MWKVVKIVGDTIKAVKAVKSFAEGQKSVPPTAEPLTGKGHIEVAGHTFGISGSFKVGECIFVVTKNDVADPKEKTETNPPVDPPKE